MLPQVLEASDYQGGILKLYVVCMCVYICVCVCVCMRALLRRSVHPLDAYNLMAFKNY